MKQSSLKSRSKSQTLSAQFGAISYMVWALLHLLAALSVYRLALTIPPSMAQGRILQNAWNLAAFSFAGFGVAIALNWRNSACGYWVNFVVIGVADIGFITFVLVPGYLPLWPGIAGPIAWAVGLMLTSIAQVKARGRL